VCLSSVRVLIIVLLHVHGLYNASHQQMKLVRLSWNGRYSNFTSRKSLLKLARMQGLALLIIDRSDAPHIVSWSAALLHRTLLPVTLLLCACRETLAPCENLRWVTCGSASGLSYRRHPKHSDPLQSGFFNRHRSRHTTASASHPIFQMARVCSQCFV